ncbi:MAG: aminoglycoside phosphotransferase family protein, partial [Sphingobacteriaceae bacterium]|nr:aminoglycoside phosphotransferase family protein [Sphingobacteriaceae bacterium]
KLSRLLNDFDATKLQETIPDFHNLSFRFAQFNEALNQCKTEFKTIASNEIEQALAHKNIVAHYELIKNHPDFKTRVMHHDTKISNVLLHENTFEGLCVIDLDTLMPGKFISDLGDMMRTYLCEFSENEADLNKITIRLPYFEAMIKGYLSEMKDSLTAIEKEQILFSGKYIIYMQALRFLSDYLNGSIYYPIHYPQQNLDRAKNQFKLLNELIANKNTLQAIVNKNLG